MPVERIKQVAVLGAGVMGHSIAQVFAQGGYPVKLFDLSSGILERATLLIGSALDTLVEFGLIARTEIPCILDRIQPTTELASAVAGADFVLEAVPEIPEVKRRLFSGLNNLCSGETILASNTSGLDIFNLVEVNSAERVIITHWFTPPYIVPLVEVVPGEKTSGEVTRSTKKILENLGKRPVVIKKFVPAFIVNRVQNAINKAVLEIIDNDWATPEDVDTAIKTSIGIRLPIVGAAQAMDFSGLDLINTINLRLGVKSPFLKARVDSGYLGAKTSKGIYDYQGQSESEILKKRDRLYLSMLKHLDKINAFQPV